MKTELNIGYLGPAGSNSHEAAELIKAPGEVLVPFSSYGLSSALLERKIAKAIMPVENSIEGRVRWVLNLLVGSGSDSFAIVGELVWSVRHCLLGFGTKTGIKTVFSHPQALGQCRAFLKSLGSIETRDTDSTSGAVEIVSRGADKTLAAIGTKSASGLYGVPIMQEDIGDSKDNKTRFIILGEDATKPTGKDKTSIVFGVKNESGALHDVTGVLNALDINMTMIFSEQSPSKKLGEYIFFVDVEGHQEDKKLSVAIEAMKRKVGFLKMLGS